MKRLKTDSEDNAKWILEQKMNGMDAWAEQMEKGTDEIYKQMYGEDWKEMRALHLQKLVLEEAEAAEKSRAAKAFLKERKDEQEVEISGFKF